MSGGTMTPGDDNSYAHLLAAVRAEKPSREARQRTVLALGLTAGAAGSLAPAAAKKGMLGLWLKLLGGTMAGAFIGVLVWQGLAARGAGNVEGNPGIRAGTSSMEAPASSSAAAVSEQQASTAPVPIESLPRVAASDRGANVVVPTSPVVPKLATAVEEPRPVASAVSPADLLAAEVRALDEVRQALRSGGAARALTLLDAYAKEHRVPVLGNEAQVLRIEALMRIGRQGDARAMATEYLRMWPNSPFAPKVRALTGMD